MTAIRTLKAQLDQGYRRNGIWAFLATCAALIPFLPGLSNSRVFYIRDLSQYFWGRYLWLRRAWLSGEWPLWDPFVGSGQAAYSDALNQMFLPPAILARIVGGEAFGFNLWVALPFPLAALGGWLCFSRRFSAAASTIGAIAFAVCGPVVSTGNVPNLSWSVAALPWAVWATDRIVARQTPRNVAILAVVIALQSLSGEPVTLFTTLGLVASYAALVGDPSGHGAVVPATRSLLGTGIAAVIGLALAAVQLVPMAQASARAGRADTIITDAWSLRPTALVETIWPQLFGNYFETRTLADVPWMPLLYTGREPLLFSLYFGVPLLTLAIFGLSGPGHRRWRLFWVSAGMVSIIASFGSYTPIYPILRDHVPPFNLFRFPVKYLFVAAMAIAAGAAAGWDGLARRLPAAERADRADARRAGRARMLGVAFPAAIACCLLLAAAACLYLPVPVGDSLSSFARAMGDQEGTEAAKWMLRTILQDAGPIVVVALIVAALFVLLASTRHSAVALAGRGALGTVIVVDLVVRASIINPVLDVAHFAEPEWLSYMKADPDARFYVGGKRDGSLSGLDMDGSRGYIDAPGLTGSASRAALNIQAAFYPSPWRARELFTYDLPVLWPRDFANVSQRFFDAGSEVRDRVLDRGGVRYRILPHRRAGNRVSLIPIPQFYESFLFDFGDAPADRVSIVPRARMIPQVEAQIEALFEDGWDSREMVLVDRVTSPAGTRGRPVEPYARVVEDSPNHVVVEAGVSALDGYLVFLDSYSEDWRVTVDGHHAVLARANGLWRAVHLPPGPHRLEFHYRPRALAIGGVISLGALLCIAGLLVIDARRRQASQPRSALAA